MGRTFGSSADDDVNLAAAIGVGAAPNVASRHPHGVRSLPQTAHRTRNEGRLQESYVRKVCEDVQNCTVLYILLTYCIQLLCSVVGTLDGKSHGPMTL